MGSIPRWVRLAAALTVLVASIEAHAQDGCFPDVPIPGWAAGDLIALALPGASRPLPINRFELCSASPGFGPLSDGYRYLVQRYDGDVVFTALLERIDDRGLGGLVLRPDERTANAAYVRITAHLRTDGTALLRSAMRPAAGDPADAMGAVPMVVELPVWLRVARNGTQVVTSFAEPGDPFADHLVVDTAGSELDANPLVYGMVQASEDVAASASAIFGEIQIDVPNDPPPALSTCVDGFVTPTAGGKPIHLRGDFLDRATGASIAGVPARILAQTQTALVLEPGPSPGGVRIGNVVLDSARGPVALHQRVAYAGEPFVRGDINGDERVGLTDVLALGRFLAGHGDLACREAADANADRRVDTRDVHRLIVFLLFGRPTLSAPFPKPGFAPEGGFSCGLPPGPRLSALRDGRGRRLPTHMRLREGDEIILEGSAFPPDPARALVAFGNVVTEVLPDSSERALHLRIATVPSSGRKCPVVLLDTAVEPIPEALRTTPETLNRLGVAYGVPPEAHRPDLCPRFEASPLARAASARLLPDRRALFLPFERATWDPSDEVQININLYLPLVDGLSRGSRIVRFHYRDPAQALRSSGVPYEEWLQRLAGRITRELNGAGPGPCGCDAEAEADADAGGIVIGPCDPVITWEDPGAGPDPPPPPFEFPLKGPPPPIWGADWFKTVVNCADPGDPESNPRKFMWCNFAELIQPHPNTGLPLWEYYFPAEYLHVETPGTYAVPSLADLPDPPDRSPADKEIMFHPVAHGDALDWGYVDPCAIAARAYYCGGGNADWMPAFSDAARVVKTFWLSESKLPLHADPDDYYSYQPPQGGRKYLGGIHMAVSNGDQFGGYFDWATFFVPKPPGDNTTKDGSPLSFNPACSVGTLNDRPEEITGVWEHYVLCTDSAPGEHSCGNPWGPANECQALSCAECHVQLGGVSNDFSGLGEIATAWLPTFATNSVSECLDEIEDSGGTVYSWLAPVECQ